MKKKNIINKYRWPAVTALVIFLIYFFTTNSTVSFYRDSGELITSAYTLSIAHSPGYPLYMILGKLFITLLGVFGVNPAYSMNIFSAFAGAAGIFFIIAALYEITDNIYVAEFAGLITAFTYVNWMLAVVAEMYSLSLFFGAFLFFLMIKKKYTLFSFIFALSLGSHLSILFAVIPMAAALYLFMPAFKRVPFKSVVLYFIAGIAVYAYLPLRAQAAPFINWGDPSDFKRFIEVVSRSSYGHTLDLVSREVTLAQVYIPQLKVFFTALFRDITLPGLVLSGFGIYYGFKNFRFRKISFVLAGIFMLTGPYFLYLARMPLNPHANAIVEVGYIFPELALAFFAGTGLLFIVKKLKFISRWVYGASLLIILYGIFNIYPKANKKNLHFADDYAYNILNTAEKNSIIIMRRDHTMFALWYKSYVENFRPDVKVLSKGLLSAKWYRDKLNNDFPGIAWKKDYINDNDYIEWIVRKYGENNSVYITPAAASELGNDFFSRHEIIPCGLVEKIDKKGSKADMDDTLSKTVERYRYSGNYNTASYYDFFAKDFISLYARAYSRLGTGFLKSGDLQAAQKLYLKAIEFSSDLPEAHSNLAYLYLEKNDLKKAAELFLASIELLKKKMSEFTRKEMFKNKLARQYNNLGAVYEKKYRKEREEKYFNEALRSYNNAIGYDRD
ncbi:MAG: DUF2723 domain-containing protein, partial [Elusimicrobia bacterium]|nr:DUF2723 domain-containing protein [Elusimicrobiota bacterium]